MDTKLIKTFVTIVEKGSMVAAATQLHISPAAVAQQVKALEKQVDAKLLRRAGRTVAVTEAGARILSHCNILLKNAEDLHAIATDSSIGGELRLGAGGTALTGIVPSVLAKTTEKFPKISVYIKTGMSIDMFELVKLGELDAAFVIGSPQELQHKTCGWELLREEPLVVIAPKKMANRQPNELLANEPFIRYDRSGRGGYLVDQYLQKCKITPNERIELNSLHAIAAMVDKNLGVSLVPDWATPWLADLNLVKLNLEIKHEPRCVGFVWNRASSRIRLLKAFLKEVKQYQSDFGLSNSKGMN